MFDERTTSQTPVAGLYTVEHLVALDLLKERGSIEPDDSEEDRIFADIAAAGFARKEGNVYVYSGDSLPGWVWEFASRVRSHKGGIVGYILGLLSHLIFGLALLTGLAVVALKLTGLVEWGWEWAWFAPIGLLMFSAGVAMIVQAGVSLPVP
jgi:hypothetical protein